MSSRALIWTLYGLLFSVVAVFLSMGSWAGDARAWVVFSAAAATAACLISWRWGRGDVA
jgi:hypothetical protein